MSISETSPFLEVMFESVYLLVRFIQSVWFNWFVLVRFGLASGADLSKIPTCRRQRFGLETFKIQCKLEFRVSIIKSKPLLFSS